MSNDIKVPDHDFLSVHKIKVFNPVDPRLTQKRPYEYVYGYVLPNDKAIDDVKQKLIEFATHLKSLGVYLEIVKCTDLSSFLNSKKENQRNVLCAFTESTFLLKGHRDVVFVENNMKTLQKECFTKHELANGSSYLATHASVMEVYTLQKNGLVQETVHCATKKGTLRRDKHGSHAGTAYDWDDIFHPSGRTKMTYADLDALGEKCSARTDNFSKITNFLKYSKGINMKHSPQPVKEPIDFSFDMANYMRTIAIKDRLVYFNESGVWDETLSGTSLNKILAHIINQGVFFRMSTEKGERVIWCPGLNAGIPLTPKSTPTHEIVFQNHDFIHHLVPDPIVDAPKKGTEKLHRKTYITFRLMSEAVTLVVADMKFVNNILDRGIDYETVDQRKIFPIFRLIKKNNPQLFDAKRMDGTFHQLVLGSVEHCFFGDTKIWEKMMIPENEIMTDVIQKEIDECIAPYREKFDKFFRADCMWSTVNYNEMAKTLNRRGEWYDRVKHWYGKGVNIKHYSVSELIDTFKIDEKFKFDVNGLSIEDENKMNKELVYEIFNIIWNYMILPVFNQPLEKMDGEMCRQNAFVRYFIGQSFAYFKTSASGKSMFEEMDSLFLQTPQFTPEAISGLRELYNSHMDQLAENSVITGTEATNFKTVCPQFPTNFADYSTTYDDNVTNESIVNDCLNGVSLDSFGRKV